MATCAITGQIVTATGAGAAGIPVVLTPHPLSEGAAVVIGGVGVLTSEVEVTTDVNGDFSIDAEQGFSYVLTIDAIGYERSFVAPAAATVRFDLLGLTPFIETASDYTDAEGDTYIDVALKVDEVDTVRQRFDQLSLERASSIDGAYSEVETFDLEPGVIFYSAILDGPSTDFFRARYVDTASGDVSSYSEVKSGDAEDEEIIMSVDELKENYLFGTDLTDDDGNPFPDRMLAHYIAAAAARLEKELDIPIIARDYTDELHDHYADDYGRWGYFQLDHHPIIEVSKVAFMYPSQGAESVIDEDWVIVENHSGVIQIVPGQGDISEALIIPGALMPMWSGASGRVPGIWRFDYRAGFEPGTLPDDIKHVVGMWAAIGVFNIAGDLIAGAGIASTSIGIPGLNQSIGTTSSATNSGYGARIIEYQKEIKEMLPLLRRYYGQGTRMVVA